MEEIVYFDFQTALSSIKQGLKVSRRMYGNNEKLLIIDSKVVIDVGNGITLDFAADSETLMAEDYYLVLDPEPITIPETPEIPEVSEELINKAEVMKGKMDAQWGAK
jgi:hypothetical protein